MLGVVPLVVGKTRQAQANRTTQERLRAISSAASERLVFRLPELADRDFLLEMAQDPVAVEANGWNDDQHKTIQTIFENPANISQFQKNELIATEESTGSLIGTATFANSPYGPRGSRQVGIHVHPDHRGKGYGREIMAAGIILLQYSSRPAFVGTKATNMGLRRIMEQLGFALEPGEHTYKAPNGEVYDAVWYRCGADVHPPTGLFGV